MSGSHFKMNVTSCDLVTGANITHIFINQTTDILNEKSLDTKLPVDVSIELNTSNSTSASKKSSSLYSGSFNGGRDAVMSILNDETPYEYSKIVQPSQLILPIDNNESHSCQICVNENAALKSVCEAFNTDTIRPECNTNTNYTYPSSEDDENYCGYSIADISDIDELSDSILNGCQSSPLREQTRVQTNDSSHGYNSSGDSEADGIVMFLDKRNNEVRI